jgi:hypothetical protein
LALITSTVHLSEKIKKVWGNQYESRKLHRLRMAANYIACEWRQFVLQKNRDPHWF